MLYNQAVTSEHINDGFKILYQEQMCDITETTSIQY